jgi:hypothetical protein
MKELLNEIKWFWKFNVKHPWYNFRGGVRNLFTHFKIVWGSGDFDYSYILQMMKFKLERLEKTLQGGDEVDKDRLPKIEDIKRCIELINNNIEDNYAERCGYLYGDSKYDFVPIEKNGDGQQLYEMVVTRATQTDDEVKEIFKKAQELEQKEWEELWEIFKKGNKSSVDMRGWWD